MWGTSLLNYKHFSCQSSCLLLLLEVRKDHYRKESLVLTLASKAEILNSFKRDLAKHIYITLGVYEFLNIHIFNWYKALYSASSSTFWHLDFIRAVWWLRAASPWCILKDRQLCLHKYAKYWLLYSIIAKAKEIKIKDMTLTRIRLLL